MSLKRERIQKELLCTWAGEFVRIGVVRGMRLSIYASSIVSTGANWSLEVKRRIGANWVSFGTAKTLVKGTTVEHSLSETDMAGASEIGVFVSTALTGGDYGLVAIDFVRETEVTEGIVAGVNGGGASTGDAGGDAEGGDGGVDLGEGSGGAAEF